MLVSVDVASAYLLLNHGPTVLISSAYDGKQNVMAAAWNMPLDFNPSKIAIVIDKSTYTRGLIAASGTFAINVPCRAQADMVLKVGSSSGRELLGHTPDNKLGAFNLTSFPATKIDAPLLAGCVAWLECKIIPEPHIQNTYDLFLAEVVAAYADNRVFYQDVHGYFGWHFDGPDKEKLSQLRTIHYIAGGSFMAIGDSFAAQSD